MRLFQKLCQNFQKLQVIELESYQKRRENKTKSDEKEEKLLNVFSTMKNEEMLQ